MGISIDMLEWQKASFATHKQLAGVILPEDAVTQQIIDVLTASGRLLITQHYKGVMLETSSYVGRIVLGDVRITIRPKIDALPFLQLLRYAYGLRDLELFSQMQFDAETFTFQDLFIAQLTSEVSELLQRGLQRRYVSREELLTVPRGRLSLQKIATQGGLYQAALPCTYYQRMEDHLLHQVLLQGLRLGIQLTSDEALRSRLQHLEHIHFADISPIRLSGHILDRASQSINRLTAHYQPALTLIEILFAAGGISMDEQQTVPIPGFLFDMNLFFQKLIERFLTDHLPDYDVRGQYSLDALMIYVENPQKRKAPLLRPDYVIKRRGKIVAILDAKYRDLWQKELPSGMLYQLVMYAIGQDDCNSVTILYPTTTPDAEEARIEVRIPGHNKGYVSVVLRPVHLLQLAMVLREGRERDNRRERGDFALKLLGPSSGFYRYQP